MKPAHPLLSLLGSQTPPPIPRGRVVKKLGAWSEANSPLGPPMPKTAPTPNLTERAYALLLKRPHSKTDLAAAVQCKKNSLTNVITKLKKQHLITRTGDSKSDNVIYYAAKPTKQRTAK